MGADFCPATETNRTQALCRRLGSPGRAKKMCQEDGAEFMCVPEQKGARAVIARVEHRVNFYDTDAMEVVHHANYIRWFEIGRVEFLRQAGITLGELMADGYVFPITEVSAKFLTAGVFDDVLVIETAPTALTKVKMAFDYRVLRPSDGAVLVTGHTQNVFTSRETGHIVRLPAKYHEKLTRALEQ